MTNILWLLLGQRVSQYVQLPLCPTMHLYRKCMFSFPCVPQCTCLWNVWGEQSPITTPLFMVFNSLCVWIPVYNFSHWPLLWSSYHSFYRCKYHPLCLSTYDSNYYVLHCLFKLWRMYMKILVWPVCLLVMNFFKLISLVFV